jgi:hypothetical protein
VQALEAVVRQLGHPIPPRPQTKFTLDTPAAILQQAVTFENLGAAAYLGQADRIVSKPLLAAALAIHSVEARHAAALSVVAKVDPSPGGAFTVPQTAFNAISAIQPYLV